VREPADVFEHLADQAGLGGDQALVRVSASRRDECEKKTLRGSGGEVSKAGIFQQITDEKSNGVGSRIRIESGGREGWTL